MKELANLKTTRSGRVVPSKIAHESQVMNGRPAPPKRETLRQLDAYVYYAESGGNCAEAARSCGLGVYTVQKWAMRFGWRERLEQINGKARQNLEDELTSGRTRRMRKQLMLGELLIDKSTEFMTEIGVESGRNAVAAAKCGSNLIAEIDQIPEIILQLVHMSPGRTGGFHGRIAD